MSLMSIVEGRHSRKNRGKIILGVWRNERIDCGHRMDIIRVYFCIYRSVTDGCKSKKQPDV